MAKSQLTTEVILHTRIAKIPVALSGRVREDGLNEISGCITINKTLSSILGDLGDNYGYAANVLKEFLGEAVISLDKVAAAYNKKEPKFAQIGLLMNVGASSCQFALLKNIGKDGFIAGLDFRSNKTPLPKTINFLSGLIGDITIANLGIYYASEDFSDVTFYSGNDFIDATELTLDIPEIKGKDRYFPKGLSFSSEILIGGINLLDFDKPDIIAQGKTDLGKQTASGVSKEGEAEKALGKGFTKWFKVNKVVGPLSIKQVGFSYESRRIGIKFDAGLRLSCLTLSLEGMGLSYPLDSISKDPQVIWKSLKFHLDGAAVAFEQGPITISGGLLKVKDVPLQLDGTLLIQTDVFTITALGSYANLDGTPSFFMFAALQKELGGPNFFFVMGLAFGFGVNRALKLPDITEVHNFPLIKAATDPEYLGKELDLRDVSQKLGDYISPSPGNFWIAAGIKFTSFNQIDSFALLSVSFGTQFEIALLGLSKIQIPKMLPADKSGNEKTPVIVYAELAMKAVFAPESGVLSFEARLTENSYILRKEFKLRGGFAFYSWFAGEHEGDFVVSLGGYHKKFQPPAHYPRPDLVEFNCKIEDVTIEGYCYFAICPSAIMAGGGLSIVYQSGGIRAWFIAYADFLIQWKPLYYDIAIGVTIGVALNLKVGFIRVKLSVELGASVDLHGPPLGGKARISLYIISFTVKFGAGRRMPPPLFWESDDAEKSFAKSFLPDSDITRITITDGLLEEVNYGDETYRIVNPHKLIMSCRTVVPATHVMFNDKDVGNQESRWTTDMGVRPMGKERIYSFITCRFAPNGGGSHENEKAQEYLAQYLDVSVVTKNVPRALWGKPVREEDKNKPPKANEQMINNALVGLEIKTKAGPRPWETPALDMEVLAYDRYFKLFNWTAIKDTPKLTAFGKKTISNNITEPEVVEKRTAIIEVLRKDRKELIANGEISLEQLKNAEYIFQAMPMMARVGQYPPRGYLEV